MSRVVDILGQTFGRLMVISRAPSDSNGQARWVCACSCGAKRVCYTKNLMRGVTKSCGCLNQENRIKHGMVDTPEYAIWENMVQRCTNPSCPEYKNYGLRGITIHPPWRDFKVFIADIGRRPGPEYSFDRLDNNEGYYPLNCRWATKDEQNSNKRNTAYLTYQGQTKPVAKWATEYGLTVPVLRARVFQCGWSVERALNTSVKSRA